MTQLTDENIQKTRQHFADNCDACIAEAKAGVFKVNDLATFIALCEASKAEWLSGANDRTLTARQHATWLQTGIMCAILP